MNFFREAHIDGILGNGMTQKNISVQTPSRRSYSAVDTIICDVSKSEYHLLLNSTFTGRQYKNG